MAETAPMPTEAPQRLPVPRPPQLWPQPPQSQQWPQPRPQPLRFRPLLGGLTMVALTVGGLVVLSPVSATAPRPR